MTRTTTAIPMAHEKRWGELIAILQRKGVIRPDFSGEVKINFSSGGIRSIVRTEVLKGGTNHDSQHDPR